RAVSAAYDGKIHVWDLDSGNRVLTFGKHKKGVEHVVLSPDSKTAVSVCLDRVFFVWELETGKVLRRLDSLSSFAIHVCMSPDGQKVIASETDQRTKAWLTKTGEKIFDLPQPRSFEEDEDYSMNALAFTPDGAKGLGGSNSGE